MIEFRGEVLTVDQWAARAGVTRRQFMRRLNTLPLAEALKPKGSLYSSANLRPRKAWKQHKTERPDDPLNLALRDWRGPVSPYPLRGWLGEKP